MNQYTNYSHEIPFSDKKKKEWIVTQAKKFWNQYTTTSKAFYNDRYKAVERRLHLLGRPDTNQFKKILVPKELANGDASQMRIDWSPLPIVSKVFKMIHSIVEKAGYDIDVQAIDPVAQDDKEKYYAELQSKLIMAAELAEAGVSPQEVGLSKEDPQTLEEAELHMKFGYKHQAAYECESALNLILKDNKYDETRSQVIDDLIAHGAGIVMDDVDFDGEIIPKYVRYEDFFCDSTNDPYHNDITMAGHICEMSIGEIKNHSTPEEAGTASFDAMVQSGISKTRYNHQRSERSIHDNNVMKHVAIMQFISHSEIPYEAIKKEDGKTVFGHKTKGNKNKELINANYDLVYEVKWVLDTDYYFGAKLVTNMKRDASDLKKGYLNYHVVAPKLYENKTFAFGDQVMSIDKALHIAWFKLQNVIARAKPKGILIEANAMNDVTVGGQKVPFKDNLAMYAFSGNLMYRKVDDDGEVAGDIPIRELDNGIKDEADRYFGIIQQEMQLLRDITGFNEITDGSTPNARMLKSVGQMAQQSTNNAINYLMTAEQKITEKLCRSLMMRIQDAAEDGTINGYEKALGSNSMEFFKLSKDVSFRNLGIYFNNHPDVYEKELMVQRLETALQSGQITLSDVIWIEGLTNIYQQKLYLDSRIKKNEERKAMLERQNMEVNAQTQQQSLQMSQQADSQKMQMEHQSKMEQINAEGQWRMQIEQLRMQGLNIQEQEKSRARAYQTDKNADAKIVSTEISSKGKEIAVEEE